MEKEIVNNYKIDDNKLVLFNEHSYNNNSIIADITHSKLITMIDNELELFCLLKHVFTKQQIILKLLEHELINYIPDSKILDINELIKQIFTILKKYNLLFIKYLEDTEWELIDKSEIFVIEDNTKVILNSINKYNKKNNDFITLMKNLISHINRYTISNNAKYKIIDDEQHEIVWVLIIVKN
jgi:hypothetical protein